MGIDKKYKTAPLPEEFEFSLLGSGKAYGECIVLHLGNNKWGIIDNCVNQVTRKPLSTQYLKEINVPLENVQFILCTHWHQDHITNIVSVFEQCKNADFYISSALNCSEFINLLHFKNNIISVFNPAREFIKLTKLVKETGRKLKRVNQDQCIFYETVLGKDMSVYALSPTDETKKHFEESTRKLLENIQSDTSDIISKPEPNLQSVVSCINIGNTMSILLGADLENSNQKGLGWNGVLESKIIKRFGRSMIFKVPHHGSENGYNEDIWEQLVFSVDSTLVTTPIIKGDKTLLPSIPMIQTICKFSENFLITSNPYVIKKGKGKWKNQKIIDDLGLQISKIAYEYGHIRIRKKITDNSTLTVEKFGAALTINCNEF